VVGNFRVFSGDSAVRMSAVRECSVSGEHFLNGHRPILGARNSREAHGLLRRRNEVGLYAMVRRVLSSLAFLPVAWRCGRRPLLGGILTLWACIDSQVYLAVSVYLTPVPQNTARTQEDDDDDYVLDLTGRPTPSKGLRRNGCSPSSRLSQQTVIPKVCLSHRLPPLTTHFCEHDSRNGLGGPLLC
jgi:hypothetical protein